MKLFFMVKFWKFFPSPVKVPAAIFSSTVPLEPLVVTKN